MIANADIRNAAKEKKVRHWQLAEELGMSEALFYKKMRHELPLEDKERYLAAIETVSSR